MKKQALRLIRIGFDNLENRNAEYITDCGIFVDDETGSPNSRTAFSKIERFLQESGEHKFYLGWDKNVYPQYKVETVELK